MALTSRTKPKRLVGRLVWPWIKRFTPRSILRRLINQVFLRRIRESDEPEARQIFSAIYAGHVWGRGAPSDSSARGKTFYSGSGSHNPHVVQPYVQAVAAFLAAQPSRPCVADLGCGDFAVGSMIRHLCADYVACDVVDDLIEFNRVQFQGLNVDFRVLDITRDELPSADVAFVRQVLQHLSNAQIAQVIPRLLRAYRYLVVTEHLPQGDFISNLDKPVGAGTRLSGGFGGSGVVLTDPPFHLRPVRAEVLCETYEHGGLLRTLLYSLV